MEEKVAEAMAESFINLPSIKIIAEDWISEWCFDEQNDRLYSLTKHYVEFYARNPDKLNTETEFIEFLNDKIAELRAKAQKTRVLRCF